MARRVSIVRAQDAPNFIVHSEELSRFGSLGAAFEAAYAAGGEIRDAARHWLENWRLGGRCEVCELGPYGREKSFRRNDEELHGSGERYILRAPALITTSVGARKYGTRSVTVPTRIGAYCHGVYADVPRA